MNSFINKLLHLAPWREVMATWAGLAAGVLLARQLMIVLAAEQGRKHDLVRRLPKQGQELQLSILIPFLDPEAHSDLLNLLHAISVQDYPAERVRVHLVTREDTTLLPQSLRFNVRVWRYPERAARYEKALSWLMTRCLALGTGGMFVFLKPTDMIKPDFLRNVAARGLDVPVLQGYVAFKNPPATLPEKACALSTRLFNRIGNAGRYHAGLSCRLLDSGWAIRAELLEMVPFRRGVDVDNLEYTLRLSLEDFRVHWAPGVVVYSDVRTSFLSQTALGLGAWINRMGLLLRYGPRLLLHFRRNDWEQALSLLTPPYFLTTLLLAIPAALSAYTVLPIPGGESFWASLAGLSLALNLLGLAVARCKPADYVTMLWHTPCAYILALPALPLAAYLYARNIWNNRQSTGSGLYRKNPVTRFNEELATPANWLEDDAARHGIHHLLRENAPPENMHGIEQGSGASFATSPVGRKANGRVPLAGNAPGAHQPDPSLDPYDVEPSEAHGYDGQETEAEASTEISGDSREMVRSIPVSNGKRQIHCRLKVLSQYDSEGRESYRLTLEYKNVAFSTASYRILDQAFYELHTKLTSRGLTMMTCGSCGYFYNPTADVPESISNAGVCLFDKQGREVSLNADAVTAVSLACPHRCPLERRESIVRQWKDSLTALSHTS